MQRRTWVTHFRKSNFKHKMKRLQIRQKPEYEKLYVDEKILHEIAAVNLLKIYFLKITKKTSKPNNRDLNCNWIISFLTVSLNEMNYRMRHIKLFKIQNSHLQVFCKIGFFKNFAKFTEIHLCQSLFSIKVASELWQLIYRTPTDDCFWKWNTFFRSKFLNIDF